MVIVTFRFHFLWKIHESNLMWWVSGGSSRVWCYKNIRSTVVEESPLRRSAFHPCKSAVGAITKPESFRFFFFLFLPLMVLSFLFAPAAVCVSVARKSLCRRNKLDFSWLSRFDGQDNVTINNVRMRKTGVGLYEVVILVVALRWDFKEQTLTFSLLVLLPHHIHNPNEYGDAQ